jgi:hypothetical protein
MFMPKISIAMDVMVAPTETTTTEINPIIKRAKPVKGINSFLTHVSLVSPPWAGKPCPILIILDH